MRYTIIDRIRKDEIRKVLNIFDRSKMKEYSAPWLEHLQR